MGGMFRFSMYVYSRFPLYIIFNIIKVRSEKNAYLIFVIFFTRTKFLENKIYTEKRQFFAINMLNL